MSWLTQSIGVIARQSPGATDGFYDFQLKRIDGLGAAANG